MRIGLVTLAYNEQRLIKPFLKRIPKWVDKKVVLVSAVPWQGKPELPDDTDIIAKKLGADVIVHAWENEQEQRNAGQEYLSDMDWIIVLDPDEFLDNKGWEALKEFIYAKQSESAFVVREQYTYWKRGYRIDPLEDYRQIILVKPSVRFVDKRVVDCNWGYVPCTLHHMSWRRTDQEVWSKICHYSHADEFDKQRWFNEVWKKWSLGKKDLHPLTPSALRQAVPCELPPELQRLGL